ncbi:MAG: HPr(Ser) kinase/phosphatase [Candidatus Competibacteraceae bacterium]|jgi:HPr kinase/phosphorylase|nr:HPr(Ser) kinase/phosphatase [Candidatus Competibacteraceae bacterium]
MSEPITTQTVFAALETPLKLSWVGGQTGGERVLQSANQTDSPWVGRLDWILPPRIQILGNEEFVFLHSLDNSGRETLIDRLLTSPSAAVLVCGDLAHALQLQNAANQAQMPLWHTPEQPNTALEWLVDYQRRQGPSILMHGELLEVFGLGVLITGASGTGKSELALELISRGHRLIADDTPQLMRVAPNVLEGTCPPALRDFLEVRGLGILNIRRMFGDSAIKRNKRVRLIVRLVRAEEMELPAELRLHGARASREILAVRVPQLSLPIAAGRNLAVLLECAVRDHIQRLQGYAADQELTDRLQQEMTPSCA